MGDSETEDNELVGRGKCCNARSVGQDLQLIGNGVGETHPDETVCFMCIVYTQGVLRLVALCEHEISRVSAESVSCRRE